MTAKPPLRSPRKPTIKRLFTFCRNQCAFPGCTDELVKGDTVVGEICHIEGARAGSARYRAGQDSEERHGYDNLVLMCNLHHAEIDKDEERYTVEWLKEIKQVHEEEATPLPPALLEHATNLFTAVVEADLLNVQNMYVGALNVAVPAKPKSDAFEAGQGPLGLLAPELARVLAQQIHMLDRAIVQFSTASACHAPPSDPWTAFRPIKPSLYPSAPACLELAHGDAMLLAEFYSSAQGIDDLVCRWHEQYPDWDMNMWNVLMQTIGDNVKAGLQAAARFCPSRLYDSKVLVLGTCDERGNAVLNKMGDVMSIHLERFTRIQAAIKSVRERGRVGFTGIDFASELTRLAGGSRAAWTVALDAGARCAALPLGQIDTYYCRRWNALSRDEIAMAWIIIARQKKLSLDERSRPDPVAISH